MGGEARTEGDDIGDPGDPGDPDRPGDDPQDLPGIVDATVAEAVADAVATPLLLAGDGDPEVAMRRWVSLRTSVDSAVAGRLREARVEPGRTLFAAVGASLATGIGDIEALAERARDEARDPIRRADAQRALAKLGTWRGNTLKTAALAEQAASAVAPFDGRREAELRLDASTTLLNAGHLELAEATARRAVEASTPWPELAPIARTLLDLIFVLRGRSTTVEAPEASVLDALGSDDVRIGVFGASQLVWSGRHEEARALLGRTEAMARATAPDALPFVLAVVADLDHRAGWWRSGYDAAEEGEARAQRSGSQNVRALLLVRGARFDAARGDRVSCSARLADVDRIEPAAALMNVRLHASSARALLALGEGDHELALAHAEKAIQIGHDMDLGHPGVDLVRGDLIEALVHTGQTERAAQEVDELETQAIAFDNHPAWAVAERGRLLLAADDEIESFGRSALAHHDQVTMPFELARTNLVLGQRRRRAGHRRDARVALQLAHADFARLGARPWADRALAELRAAGGRVDPRDGEDSSLRVLSPQELEVARVVADGATNKEAASALFLSQKSIERHLTAAYRKLGLRSRTELARWFDLRARDGADGHL